MRGPATGAWPTGAVPRALRTLGRLAGSHPLVPWLLAAVYVSIGIGNVLSDTFLNDEGLLAYYFAGMLWDAPFHVFFWQKSRPFLSLLYAPAAAGGLSIFLIAHVVVASFAGPLAAAVARIWDHRYPNLPAVLVLASPLLIAAGPAGVTNADAVVLAVLAVWLAARGQVLPAGFVLGSLFFVRAELTLLVLALAALGLFERRFRRVLVGIVAVPTAYWLLGILFHRDLLWIVRYPPSLTSPNPAIPIFEQMATPGGPGAVGPALLALTPAVGMAVLARWRRLPPMEWSTAAFALGFLLALRWIPFLGAFNFGSSPRYILPALPFVALLASRTFTRWCDAGEPRWSAAWLAGFLVVAHWVDVQSGWPWLLLAVVVWSVLAALASERRPGLAAALGVAATVASVPGLLPATELAVADMHPELASAVAWLQDHPQVARARPVFTNMHLLATYARRTAGAPPIDVRQIVPSDQRFEIAELTNPHVGQRDRILELLDRHYYATPVHPDALQPENLPQGALFVIVDDARLEGVMPTPRWRPHLETLATGSRWRILVLRSRR